MERLKELARFLLKAIIGIAALVFVVTNPFSGKREGLAFFASILVMLVCGGFAMWLQNDDDRNPDDNRPIN